MSLLHSFFRLNKVALLGMLVGLINGYAYWLHFGIYDGTSAFSSEWWTNCVYGVLFGGLAGSIVSSRIQHKDDEAVISENDI